MNNNLQNNKTFRLVLAALFTALTAVATLVIRIPSPMNGYVNLGDVIVLMNGWMLGPVWGTFAAGVGSMLADLIAGYAVYAPGTLVIKAICALTASLIFRALKKDAEKHVIRITKRVISALISEMIMVAGYFGYAAILMGNGLSAALSIPGNCTQAVVGILLGTIITEVLMRNGRIREYLGKS